MIVTVVLVHLVGAILSLPLLSTMPDFGVYYTAAWALRSDLSIYDWPVVVEQAQGVGIEIASNGLPYRYPPLLAMLLVPLSYLPYDVAKSLWLASLMAGTAIAGILLARWMRRPRWWVIPLTFLFGPVSLSLAWGNISCLLPLAFLGLVAALTRGRTDVRPALVFVGIAWLKVFPLSWSFVLIAARRYRLALAAGVFLLALAGLGAATLPRMTTEFARQLFGDTLAQSNPNRLGVPQPNLQSILVQSTQPWRSSYQRHGISADGWMSPRFHLSPESATRIGRAVALLGCVAVLCVGWMVTSRGRPMDGLCSAVAGFLLFQPLTAYIYLAAALPGMVRLWSSERTGLRVAAVVAFALVGCGRFAQFVTAALPHAWLLGHTATAAMLILWIAHIAEGRVLGPAARPQPGSPALRGR